ncbi:protease pro-enzyme activation domain-containing protein [Kutzneria sp. CA-103260]|uniref:protease pro-enzyme activation domain-containing protein n=1 Tax=Kutzneria sp. CA-103260 TaxID=2802641 RepID=UPI002011219C|nr:protease pro-enzyme activation domain-containing protein [Kutzneria sp. CA-103260]
MAILLAAPLALALPALAGPASAAEPQVALTGDISPAVGVSHRVGDLPTGKQLNVAVSLKLRDTAGLDRFLADVADPHSSNYGHYLTPSQFADRFGPTRQAFDQVSAYLQARGLKVTGINGQAVDATGTAAQVTAAFATPLGVYDRGGRQFFANDRNPVLPASIAGLVQGVSGLNSYTVQHHPVQNHAAQPAAPSGLGPAALRSIYDTNGIGADGTGQTVALWEFDGYKQSDISTYDQQFGLSSSAPATVSVDGANYDSSPGQGQPEVSLDIEIVQAMAPKAATLVYEAPNTDAGELDMANQIVKENKAQVVSISWGECEQDSTPSTMTSVDNAFKQGAAQGQSFFAASGDNGSKDCTRSNSGPSVVAVDFPASSPNVTGVGGTTLTVGSNNSYGSETVWNNSIGSTGGGVSTVFGAPSWQTGVNGKRTVPDVASDGDPNTGYSVYTGGQWQVYGGTSCAAPMWAGWAALYNQKAKAKLGAGNQAIYGLKGNTFHDITTGNNGDFKAGPGYDETTGWGSYDGTKLFNALNGSSTGNTVTVTNPGDQTTAVNGSVNLPIKATDSSSSAKLSYAASGLPAGLSIDAGTGVISGTATTQGVSNVTVTVTDDTQASGNTSFKWTVGTPPTGTVTVTNPGNQWGFTGYPLFQTVQISATASDGGALTFSATGLPPGLKISASGAITGTPTTAGTYSVTVTAAEANGTSGSTTFTFTVYGF